ncbi:MAG: hypothetical protein V4550_08105 [Gemmatimonadota bacterium]
MASPGAFFTAEDAEEQRNAEEKQQRVQTTRCATGDKPGIVICTSARFVALSEAKGPHLLLALFE